MRRNQDGTVLEVPRQPEATRQDVEMEMDPELFDDAFDAETLLASIEASLEDAEPWQRLSEVLGRITGELDND